MVSNLRTTISISAFIITISSFAAWSYLPLGNTAMWWGIKAILVFVLIKSKFYVYDKIDENNLLIFKIFLAWNVICIIRGSFIADGYWEWKNLISTSMVMFIPLVIYTATNTFMVQKIVNLWLKYTLPAFIILLPFIMTGAVGRYLIPISFILLFFPALPHKWKIISLIGVLFVFVFDISSRSNLLKMIVPFGFSFLYYLNRNIANITMKIGRYFFIVAPIVFFFLGVTKVFNVFNIGDYVQGDYTVQTEDASHGDLKTDTRTGLYEEVLSSALKHDYIWLGRTPARGNDSKLFGPQIAKLTKSKKLERYRNEAAILNVFTWTGVVGVILYLLIFVIASRLSIYRSNNFFIKIVGLYVTFRWFYAWIEDFREFDLSSFFLWICLGMCFSKSFRKLSDREIYLWVNGFFEKKYRVAHIKLQLLKKNNYLKNKKSLVE